MAFTADELAFINRMAGKMIDGATFDEAACMVIEETRATVERVQALRPSERKSLFSAFAADVFGGINQREGYRRAFR